MPGIQPVAAGQAGRTRVCAHGAHAQRGVVATAAQAWTTGARTRWPSSSAGASGPTSSTTTRHRSPEPAARDSDRVEAAAAHGRDPRQPDRPDRRGRTPRLVRRSRRTQDQPRRRERQARPDRPGARKSADLAIPAIPDSPQPHLTRRKSDFAVIMLNIRVRATCCIASPESFLALPGQPRCFCRYRISNSNWYRLYDSL
jgi:hypothetical protein